MKKEKLNSYRSSNLINTFESLYATNDLNIIQKFIDGIHWGTKDNIYNHGEFYDGKYKRVHDSDHASHPLISFITFKKFEALSIFLTDKVVSNIKEQSQSNNLVDVFYSAIALNETKAFSTLLNKNLMSKEHHILNGILDQISKKDDIDTKEFLNIIAQYHWSECFDLEHIDKNSIKNYLKEIDSPVSDLKNITSLNNFFMFSGRGKERHLFQTAAKYNNYPFLDFFIDNKYHKPDLNDLFFLPSNPVNVHYVHEKIKKLKLPIQDPNHGQCFLEYASATFSSLYEIEGHEPKSDPIIIQEFVEYFIKLLKDPKLSKISNTKSGLDLTSAIVWAISLKEHELFENCINMKLERPEKIIENFLENSKLLLNEPWVLEKLAIIPFNSEQAFKACSEIINTDEDDEFELEARMECIKIFLKKLDKDHLQELFNTILKEDPKNSAKWEKLLYQHEDKNLLTAKLLKL